MKTVLKLRSEAMTKENANKLANMLIDAGYVTDIHKFKNKELYSVLGKKVVEIN